MKIPRPSTSHHRPDTNEAKRGEDGESGEGEGLFADMAVAPFLARMFTFLTHDMGKNSLEDGRAALTELSGGARFARLRWYIGNVHARPSFRATWDEETQVEVWGKIGLVDRNCPEHI